MTCISFYSVTKSDSHLSVFHTFKKLIHEEPSNDMYTDTHSQSPSTKSETKMIPPKVSTEFPQYIQRLNFFSWNCQPLELMNLYHLNISKWMGSSEYMVRKKEKYFLAQVSEDKLFPKNDSL